MKKLAKKKSTKKVSDKKTVKTKRKPNPSKDLIKLTPSNLKQYGEVLLGRHNSHTVEDLVKVYSKNKLKMSQNDDYNYYDYKGDCIFNNSFKVISNFDKVLDNYGVELIRGKTPKDLIVYSNTGDSYALTVLYYNKKYYIGSLADIVVENESQYK